ncbi:MAG: alpha/beta hydrolase [Acidobacteriota bacterium]
MKQTITYKTVGDVEIKADIYRPADDLVRPVVVWIHGGALILGSRNGVQPRMRELCQQEGFALISLDYRLAPEVKLPAIIEDIQDAFRWIRGDGAKQFHLDPQKIVVAGGSAGGYLTMMTGHCISPRPLALVAYFGYGDVDGEWYREPSAFYRQSVSLISKQDAESGVGTKVISGVDAPGIDPRARNRYYIYLRQNGLWTREVTGFDPVSQKDKLDYYCPVRNISPDYPPILMVHGTQDTDVPYQKSVDMAAELQKKGVKHELVTVKDAGHGLSHGNPEDVAQAHSRAVAFIREYLK